MSYFNNPPIPVARAGVKLTGSRNPLTRALSASEPPGRTSSPAGIHESCFTKILRISVLTTSNSLRLIGRGDIYYRLYYQRLALAVLGVALHLFPHQKDQSNRSSGERRDLFCKDLFLFRSSLLFLTEGLKPTPGALTVINKSFRFYL